MKRGGVLRLSGYVRNGGRLTSRENASDKRGTKDEDRRSEKDTAIGNGAERGTGTEIEVVIAIAQRIVLTAEYPLATATHAKIDHRHQRNLRPHLWMRSPWRKLRCSSY